MSGSNADFMVTIAKIGIDGLIAKEAFSHFGGKYPSSISNINSLNPAPHSERWN